MEFLTVIIDLDNSHNNSVLNPKLAKYDNAKEQMEECYPDNPPEITKIFEYQYEEN